MKVLSCFDIVKDPALVGMTIFDVIHPSNWQQVSPVLHKLGYRVEKAIHAYAALHRTMSNEVRVGILMAGELRTDREFLRGPYAMPDDFYVAASFTDESLFSELYNLGSRCNDYGAVSSNVVDRNAAIKDTAVSAEEAQVVAEIEQLEQLIFHIRGNQYQPDGSLKEPSDYYKPEEPAIGRQRKKSTKSTKKV